MQVNDIISIFQGDQICMYSVYLYTAKFVCVDVLFSLTF